MRLRSRWCSWESDLHLLEAVDEVGAEPAGLLDQFGGGEVGEQGLEGHLHLGPGEVGPEAEVRAPTAEGDLGRRVGVGPNG